jgi:hypothetical protein
MFFRAAQKSENDAREFARDIFVLPPQFAQENRKSINQDGSLRVFRTNLRVCEHFGGRGRASPLRGLRRVLLSGVSAVRVTEIPIKGEKQWRPPSRPG